MNWTDAQRQAIETHDKDLCVDAGAGSGKTSVLVDRILSLLEGRKANLDQIVAITFTEKAAAEMKARLRAACRKKAPRDNPESMNFWRRLERHAETARISTIHSFCMALLKEHALSLGKDPDFSILTEPESYLLREEIIEEVLHDLLEAGNTAAFRLGTEYRHTELVDILRKLLSDRSVVDRILLAHPFDDPVQLLDEWHRTAEAQQRDRCKRLLHSSEMETIWQRLRTLDDSCYDPADKREVLRTTMLAELQRARSTDNPDVVADALRNIEKLAARGGSVKKWVSQVAYDTVRDIKNALTKLIAKHTFATCDPELEAKAAGLTRDLRDLYTCVREALEKAKERRNAYDFEDLIAQTVHMLRDDARGDDSVRARVARSIKYLLIDEFQDTDSIQLEIAYHLAKTPGGPQLFIVGDAKQSIYYFRGAEVEVFQSAREEADEVIRMDTNFRALPDVLRFANDFFEKSSLLHKVEEPYVPMRWHRDATGDCRVEFLIPEAGDDAGTAAYRDAEAGLLASRILDMCLGPSPVQVFDRDLDAIRNAQFGDIAVLFRSFSDVYRYERALRQAGVPYSVVAGVGFYERQEVVDLRNLLTVVVDPWHEMALLAVLRGPMVAVSDEALVRLCGDVGRPAGLAQAFYNGGTCGDAEQDERLLRGRALLKDLRAHREMPLGAFIHHVLDRTGYEAIVLGQFLGVQRASNLRKVADLATAFAQSETPKLSAFVRYLNQVTSPAVREGEAAIQAENSDAVTLMTVHKSKGLEFPIVALADMGRGSRSGYPLPLSYHRTLGMGVKVVDETGERASTPVCEAIDALREDEERAEQARVLYVGMTRARDYLLLGGPPESRGQDNWFAAFDSVYQICEREDGEEFSADGWRACVRRRIVPAPAIPEIRPTAEPLDLDTIRNHIAPAPAHASPRDAVSVTGILKAFDDRSGEHLPSKEPEFRPGEVDSQLRGTLTHRFLELWNFTSDTQPLIDELLLSECPVRSDRVKMAEHLQGLAGRFGSGTTGELVKRATDAQREATFVLRVEDKLVRGTIDLVLADGTIVDYKTGQWSEEKHATYERQVRLYAAAVRELLGRMPPAAYLCYLDAPGPGWLRPVDVSEALVQEALDETARALHATPDPIQGVTP